jgi:hypothetical protein
MITVTYTTIGALPGLGSEFLQRKKGILEENVHHNCAEYSNEWEEYLGKPNAGLKVKQPNYVFTHIVFFFPGFV